MYDSGMQRNCVIVDAVCVGAHPEFGALLQLWDLRERAIWRGSRARGILRLGRTVVLSRHCELNCRGLLT